MKKALLTALFLASAIGATIAQSYVTRSMAAKISYTCQYNERMQWLFANANNIAFGHEADKILRTLDQHLGHAENFLMAIYYNYGLEMGYYALKDMGFTIQETERVEAVWEKEEERQDALAEQQRKEEERALLEQIEANEVFGPEQLSTEPQIWIDAYDMATHQVFNDRDETMDYTYHCIIKKDGKLTLQNPADTAGWSTIQKFICRYITDPDYGAGIYQPGTVMVNGESIPVDSYVTIQFEETRYENNVQKGYLHVTIGKDRRTGLWKILPDESAEIVCPTCPDDVLKADLEEAIGNCPDLQGLKGKLCLKVCVYERRLQSNISDKIALSHLFDLSYTKSTLWEALKSSFVEEEYLPLKYKVSF